MNSYRAGVEIGSELRSIDPEVVFLFASIHFTEMPALLEAVYDALESESVVLIGGTGDGFYERTRVAAAGVSALALNSEGAVRWHIDKQMDLRADPKKATQACLERLNHACRDQGPSLYFLMSGSRADTCAIAEALETHAQAPVVGGVAGDDYRLEKAFIFAGREVLDDAVAIVAVEGPLKFAIRLAQSMEPVGPLGVITQTSESAVERFDDVPARDFITNALGKDLSLVERGILCLRLLREGEERGRLHSIEYSAEPESGAVQLMAEVQPGTRAQLCIARSEELLEDVRDQSLALDSLDFEPIAGLLVSCAGRKKFLGSRIAEEVDLFGKTEVQALAGFPSFGEFAPLKLGKGYSETLFHNMTLVILIIGS